MGALLYSYEDVGRVLNNTVCRYKGRPCYTTADGLSNNVHISFLDPGHNDSSLEVDHSSNDFDYSAPPLGYWYNGNTCTYITRRPARQWRAGLIAGMVRFSTPIGGGWLLTKATSDCILGNHKSFKEAFKDVQMSNTPITVPFDRHFAVGSSGGRITLLHRNSLIGFFSKDIGKFKLLSDNGVSVVLLSLRKAGYGDIAEF